MSEVPRCAVSIDLDPLRCYYQIHGLGPAPEPLRDVVLQQAVPRYLELFAEYGISATFFTVASDVDTGAGGSAEAAALVRQLADAGHEIGNHSYGHPYDLARYDEPRAAAEIELAHAVLSQLVGHPVRGFRAPGYDLSSAMLMSLLRLGYVYDSSIFPAPGYYAAKAAVMGALAVLGRPSGAVMTHPGALLAPAEPYRPDTEHPWRRGQASIVELPVAVTPVARIPAIGTSLLMAPAWVRDRLISQMARRSFFNFELHGIDLIDAKRDGIPQAVVDRQPDLRLSVDEKLDRLAAILERCTAEFEVSPLIDIARWAHRDAA